MTLAQLLGYLPLVVFLTAAVTGLLGAYAWRRRTVPGATPLAVLLLLMTLWATLYAVRLSVADRGLQLVAYRIEMVGAWFVPVLWLLFALEYTGRAEWVTHRRAALLGALPAVGLVLLWVAPTETMLANVSVRELGTVSVLVFDRRPLYLAIQGYFFLLIGAATALLVEMIVRWRNLYTDQAVALLVASAAPALVFLLGNVTPGVVSGVTGRPGDLIPLTFPVTGALFLFAVFRTELFRVLSTTSEVGRDTAFELMDDPALVTDEDGAVIDCNSAATSLLDVEAGNGLTVSEIPALGDIELDGGSRITEVTSPDNRTFDVQITSITDVHDRHIGYSLVLRDVTERENFRQRLQVTNRVLRHNLRNNLNVVLGRAATIGEHVDDPEVAASATEIREAAEALATTGMKARRVEELLGADVEAQRTEVGAVAREVVRAAREAHPGATVTLEGGDATAYTVPGIEVALREAVENAVVHSECDPVVGVTVECTAGDVVVTVADHGPGIPEHERRVLLDGGETQIEHGSGAGLWLMKWLVEQSGGALDIEAGAAGTTVRMVFRRSEDGPD